MSRTIAVHVRYNSLYICLSSSAKQRREMTRSCVVWRTRTSTAKFFISFLNLSLCSGFSFVIVLTMINKVSDFRVSWDLKINYKFIFLSTLSSPSPSSFRKLPNYWIRRTATWNLFVLYNNEKSFFLFQNISTQRESRPIAPPLHEKKAIRRDLWSIQNEAISLLAMHSKELWLVEKNRATVKPDSSVAPRWMKTYSKQNWTAKSTSLEKKGWKIQVSFCRSSPMNWKAWTLPWKLRELKRYPRKT